VTGEDRLLWPDVAAWFDPRTNGRLPDACVAGVSLAGWQALLDLIRSRGWASEHSVDHETFPLPQRAADLISDEGYPQIRVWPTPRIQVIFRMYTPADIDFDVDLRELQGQERLDDFCDFLRTLGRALNSRVVLCAEGYPRVPLLAYEPGRDRIEWLAPERP
jgi:hypothetical protein